MSVATKENPHALRSKAARSNVLVRFLAASSHSWKSRFRCALGARVHVFLSSHAASNALFVCERSSWRPSQSASTRGTPSPSGSCPSAQLGDVARSRSASRRCAIQLATHHSGEAEHRSMLSCSRLASSRMRALVRAPIVRSSSQTALDRYSIGLKVMAAGERRVAETECLFRFLTVVSRKQSAASRSVSLTGRPTGRRREHDTCRRSTAWQ